MGTVVSTVARAESAAQAANATQAAARCRAREHAGAGPRGEAASQACRSGEAQTGGMGEAGKDWAVPEVPGPEECAKVKRCFTIERRTILLFIHLSFIGWTRRAIGRCLTRPCSRGRPSGNWTEIRNWRGSSRELPQGLSSGVLLRGSGIQDLQRVQKAALLSASRDARARTPVSRAGEPEWGENQ